MVHTSCWLQIISLTNVLTESAEAYQIPSHGRWRLQLQVASLSPSSWLGSPKFYIWTSCHGMLGCWQTDSSCVSPTYCTIVRSRTYVAVLFRRYFWACDERECSYCTTSPKKFKNGRESQLTFSPSLKYVWSNYTWKSLLSVSKISKTHFLSINN